MLALRPNRTAPPSRQRHARGGSNKMIKPFGQESNATSNQRCIGRRTHGREIMTSAINVGRRKSRHRGNAHATTISAQRQIGSTVTVGDGSPPARRRRPSERNELSKLARNIPTLSSTTSRPSRLTTPLSLRMMNTDRYHPRTPAPYVGREKNFGIEVWHMPYPGAGARAGSAPL